MLNTIRNKIVIAIVAASLMLGICVTSIFTIHDQAQAEISTIGQHSLFDNYVAPTTNEIHNFADGTDISKFLQSTENLPTSIDLRDYNGQNLVTNVANQAPWNSCWAFGSTAAMETNLLKQGYISSTNSIFSTKHLAWFARAILQQGHNSTSNTQIGEGATTIDQSDVMNALGSSTVDVYHMYSGGQGPASNEDFPYVNNAGTIDPSGDWSIDESERFKQSQYSLSDSQVLPELRTKTLDASGQVAEWTDLDETSLNLAKAQLANGNALTISYCAAHTTSSGAHDTSYYENKKEDQLYYFDNGGDPQSNHVVCIVGYDDNIPAEYFANKGAKEQHDMNPKLKEKPEGNGGFLIKNSWGTQYADGGFFWISYYDISINQLSIYNMESNNNYDAQSYNYLSVTLEYEAPEDSVTYTANVFETDKDIQLKEVSYEVSHPNTITNVTIYKLNDNYNNPLDGSLISSESYTADYGGYYKKTLTNQPYLKTGEKYSVVLNQTINGKNTAVMNILGKNSMPNYYINSVVNKGESFYYDVEWNDLYDNHQIFKQSGIELDNFEIRAYTQQVNEIVTCSFDANGHGSAPVPIRVAAGETINPPADPICEGYNFEGWYTEKDCINKFDFTSSINDDITLYAKWTANKYIVKFVNFDNSILQESQQEYGSTPVYLGEVPTRSSSEQLTYTFIGWDPEIATVTKDSTYKAKYSENEIIAPGQNSDSGLSGITDTTQTELPNNTSTTQTGDISGIALLAFAIIATLSITTIYKAKRKF